MTQPHDKTMTKEEALKQRDNWRRGSNISQVTKHFLLFDFSKLPGADLTGMPEFGPFERYYTQRFAADLAKFYDIDNSCDIWPYPFVLSMRPPFFDEFGRTDGPNLRRLELNMVGRHFNMFAAAVFYISACAQVIGKLYGRKAMDNFHKASGWPMLSCGMGGLMSPIIVMSDSLLFPYSHDVDEFVDVFNEASQYLEADFLDFLKNDRDNLNPTAYAALRQAVDVNVVRDELEQQRDLFVDWVRDPRTPFEYYYVPIEVMKD